MRIAEELVAKIEQAHQDKGRAINTLHETLSEAVAPLGLTVANNPSYDDRIVRFEVWCALRDPE